MGLHQQPKHVKAGFLRKGGKGTDGIASIIYFHILHIIEIYTRIKGKKAGPWLLPAGRCLLRLQNLNAVAERVRHKKAGEPVQSVIVLDGNAGGHHPRP